MSLHKTTLQYHSLITLLSRSIADRRPIDPPPIVQLRVIDPAARRPPSSPSSTSEDYEAYGRGSFLLVFPLSPSPSGQYVFWHKSFIPCFSLYKLKLTISFVALTRRSRHFWSKLQRAFLPPESILLHVCQPR